MTREEILNMPAGREMDALIAEKVMGFTQVRLFRDVWTGCLDGQRKVIPHYSKDISDACEVIKEMHRNKYQYTLRGYFMGDEQHIATFDNQDWADKNPLYKAHGATAPLAICRAALLTTLEDRND